MLNTLVSTASYQFSGILLFKINFCSRRVVIATTKERKGNHGFQPYDLHFSNDVFFEGCDYLLVPPLHRLFVQKISRTDRIDNFHLFGRTQQERFVIYKRRLSLQGKHISKFIQQRKPDEGFGNSIWRKFRNKVFPISVLVFGSESWIRSWKLPAFEVSCHCFMSELTITVRELTPYLSLSGFITVT